MKGGEKIAARPMIEACIELDAAEDTAWDRIGGPSEADFGAIDMLENEIGDRRADCPEVAVWRARRLVRAILNDWHDDSVRQLAVTVESDLSLNAF